MGQYYIPYIENEDGKFTIYSHDYGNGLKLTEHSYMSNWEWRTQECYMSSVQECKKVYGLGVDCEYRIISVEEVTL